MNDKKRIPAGLIVLGCAIIASLAMIFVPKIVHNAYQKPLNYEEDLMLGEISTKDLKAMVPNAIWNKYAEKYDVSVSDYVKACKEKRNENSDFYKDADLKVITTVPITGDQFVQLKEAYEERYNIKPSAVKYVLVQMKAAYKDDGKTTKLNRLAWLPYLKVGGKWYCNSFFGEAYIGEDDLEDYLEDNYDDYDDDDYDDDDDDYDDDDDDDDYYW